MSQQGTGATSLSGVAAGDYALSWLPLEGWDPPDLVETSLAFAPGGSGGRIRDPLCLSPRGLPENHSPIFYAGSDFAGDGSWVAEIYGAGERTGRQLFRLRVSSRAIPP